MRYLIPLFISLFLCLNLAYADIVTLRQEPSAEAKSVGVVDLSKGIVPIFTPKDSDWVKVADPTNGNVGWIKQNEFKNANSASIQVNQQSVGPNGKVEDSGFSLHVGKPIDMNDPKVQANIKEMKKLQTKVQENMKTQIQDMVKGINDLYQKQLQLLEQSGFYVPNPKTTAPVSNVTSVPAPEKN